MILKSILPQFQVWFGSIFGHLNPENLDKMENMSTEKQ